MCLEQGAIAVYQHPIDCSLSHLVRYQHISQYCTPETRSHRIRAKLFSKLCHFLAGAPVEMLGFDDLGSETCSMIPGITRDLEKRASKVGMLWRK